MGYILVGMIIGGIIWGIVVNKVIENKGYKEDWFWWGFFFGIFALIVALTKQNVNTTKVVIESSAPIKENMELLSSCILNNQVNISSPVHIASWEIKKDTEKLVLFVDFINVSHKPISAVMFSATGFNSFGDRVQMNDADFFDVIGQDLSINSNECGKIYSALQDDAIRKVELKVKKVCFADGTIADDIQNEWVNANQFELNSIHIDCARRENAQSKYYAIIKEGYWQCVCGFVNTQNTCAICGMQKNNAIKYTQDNIDGTYNEYIKQIESERLEEEKRKLEEKRVQEERQARFKKKFKIAIISTLVSIGIISIAGIIINLYILPSINYNKAISYIENKEYDKAIQFLRKSNINGDKLSSVGLDLLIKEEAEGANVIFDNINEKYLLSEDVQKTYFSKASECIAENRLDDLQLYASQIKQENLKNDYFDLCYSTALESFKNEMYENTYDLLYPLRPRTQEIRDIIEIINIINNRKIALNQIEQVEKISMVMLPDALRIKINEAKKSLNAMQGCYNSRSYYLYIDGFNIYWGDKTGCYNLTDMSYNFDSSIWSSYNWSFDIVRISEMGLETDIETYRKVTINELPNTFAKYIE